VHLTDLAVRHLQCIPFTAYTIVKRSARPSKGTAIMAKAPSAKQTQNESKSAPSTDIEKRRALDEMVPEIMTNSGSSFTREQLKAVTNFDEAARLVADVHGPLVTADQEIGDGFAVLTTEQKKLLIGVPLLLMEWAFRKGDMGNFVSLRVMARNPDGSVSKYILNDGSTGIAEQLADYQKTTNRIGGMYVAKGLRASEYEIETDEGPKKAVTYYLDTAKG